MCALARAQTRAFVYAHVRSCARVRVFLHFCRQASSWRFDARGVRVERVCARAPPLCARSCGTAGTGVIYSSALLWAGGRSCVFAFGAIGRFRPALAAGVRWTLVIDGAPWAARYWHTSVVDAAGAIYVLGGYDRFGRTTYRDVWASTDGGA